ncbi:MAG: conjugal transfer protein [Actinomycetota bacterium]
MEQSHLLSRHLLSRRPGGAAAAEVSPRSRPRRPLHAAGRVLLWGAIGLVFVRGVESLFVTPPRSGSAPSTPAGPADLPGAEGIAARFSVDYLSYDQATAAARARLLSGYMPAGGDTAAGWDGRGASAATDPVSVGVEADGAGAGLVTVAVRMPGPGWAHLAVPVARDGSRLVVAGSPVFVPGPEPATSVAGPSVGPGGSAGDAAGMRPAVEAFFRAYAGGEGTDLTYVTAPGRTLSALHGLVGFAGLGELVVEGERGSATARASVRWTEPSSQAVLAQTYCLGLVERDARWYVAEASACSVADPADALARKGVGS